jgi:hypothetical protein
VWRDVTGCHDCGQAQKTWWGRLVGKQKCQNHRVRVRMWMKRGSTGKEGAGKVEDEGCSDMGNRGWEKP